MCARAAILVVVSFPRPLPAEPRQQHPVRRAQHARVGRLGGRRRRAAPPRDDHRLHEGPGRLDPPGGLESTGLSCHVQGPGRLSLRQGEKRNHGRRSEETPRDAATTARGRSRDAGAIGRWWQKGSRRDGAGSFAASGAIGRWCDEGGSIVIHDGRASRRPRGSLPCLSRGRRPARALTTPLPREPPRAPRWACLGAASRSAARSCSSARRSAARSRSRPVRRLGMDDAGWMGDAWLP